MTRYTLAGLGACALMVTTADASGLVKPGSQTAAVIQEQVASERRDPQEWPQSRAEPDSQNQQDPRSRERPLAHRTAAVTAAGGVADVREDRFFGDDRNAEVVLTAQLSAWYGQRCARGASSFSCSERSPFLWSGWRPLRPPQSRFARTGSRSPAGRRRRSTRLLVQFRRDTEGSAP